MSNHLWEVKHPYYCNETNYFASGKDSRDTQFNYESFEDFLSEWGDADPDMNLVFRWDWEEITQEAYDELMEEEEESELTPFTGDDTVKSGHLKIFFFMQRKGYFCYTCTLVSRSEEPIIKAYLKEKWDYYKKLWEPLS